MWWRVILDLNIIKDELIKLGSNYRSLVYWSQDSWHCCDFTLSGL